MSATNASAGSTSAPRIVALDVARWIAIVGMMSAHLLSSVSASWTGATDAQGAAADVVLAGANGNASSLFAVLAGASLVLATRSQLARGARAAALRSVLGRAIVVGAVGVLLAATMPPVHVVLNYLAVAMVLVAPLLLAPAWVAGVVAVGLWIGGPQLALAVRTWRFGDGVYPSGDALAGSPWAAPVDLLATGEYPATTWVAMLAVGIVIARLVLRTRTRRSTRILGLGMAGIGAVLAVAAIALSERMLARFADDWAASLGLTDMLPWLLRFGTGTAPDASWWWQATAVPHTGTIGDVARGVAVALVVVGALLALLPPGARLPRVLEPVRAAGAAPFTIYTLHVCALLVGSAVWAALGGLGMAVTNADGSVDAPPWFVAGFGILTVHMLGSLLVGMLLWRTGAKGPLERMASAVARSFAEPRAGDLEPRVR